MGFGKKAAALFGLGPDIAVVPECSKAAAENFSNAEYAGLGFGDNPRNGLGVFCRKEWGIRPICEPKEKWIVPIAVNSPEPFTLIAVWTKSKKDDYSGQLYKVLKAHPDWFHQGPAIVAGDFNSNTQWDEDGWEGSHSNVVRMLDDYGLVSAYHEHFREEQGAESRKTLYMARYRKHYHVDYIFIPKTWLPRLQSVSVGEYERWSKLSDHCPVVAEI